MSKFICIEGLDGSGKTTIMEKLKAKYEEEGLKVLVTSPFLTTDYDVQFKSDILNTKDPLIELTGMANVLFRFQNFLKKQLESKEYDIVIMDRYLPSFFTYQVYSQNEQMILASLLLFKLMTRIKLDISYYLIVANEENTKARLADRVVDDGDIRSVTTYHTLLEGYEAFFAKGGKDFHILTNNTLQDSDTNVTIIHGVSNA